MTWCESPDTLRWQKARRPSLRDKFAMRWATCCRARVEIWQCDVNGRYHFVDDNRAERPMDQDFQGYGQATTDATGGYGFRTIRPVPYPGRTPHIHFAVSAASLPRL
jgi:protocatechuate 3,4-dioxygenase beta subunit